MKFITEVIIASTEDKIMRTQRNDYLMPQTNVMPKADQPNN